MAETITIKLDVEKYFSPTQDDIQTAKAFVRLRNDYASLLGDRIDDILQDAEERIITICYKYNVEPTEFEISENYNKQMMEEIGNVMDEIEDEILDLIYEYSTRCTNDKERINLLTAWMALLGRGNRNLKTTLHGYLYKTLRDWESAIAALRFADVPLSSAVTKGKTFMHSIYTMPEVISAFKRAEDFNATYIRKRGVQEGAVGISNNGSTNVVNMAKTTLQMAWMRNLVLDYEESGAAGIYILRGSNFPCTLCDDVCGFHSVNDAQGILPVHPHCCCYAIPIYQRNNQNK